MISFIYTTNLFFEQILSLVNNKWRSQMRYCGNYGATTYLSVTNKIRLAFTSDKSDTAQG